MFLPADNIKFINKAIESEADAIILDVEDSVHKTKREIARNNIIQYAEQGKFKEKTTYVRINAIEEEDFVHDISSLVINGIDGFMPSKIKSDLDLIFLDKLLSFWERKNHIEVGSIKLAPLIETTQAIECIERIAKSSDRLVALCFGSEDYLNDLGCIFTSQESALVYPRARIVNTARANNLLPIDSPYLKIDDLQGFKEKTELSYKNGFAGRLIINPRQIEVSNEMYTPSAEKLSQAKRIVEVVQQREVDKTGAIVMLDGGMIGPPMKKQAENILQQMCMLDEMND